MNRLTIDNALAQLEQSDAPFAELFKHGSMSIEFYKPDRIDQQKPHTRDEIYIVASGRGIFENDGERRPFVRGEVLFVPAHVAHRFIDFTPDFATWVIFYGPPGGEQA